MRVKWACNLLVMRQTSLKGSGRLAHEIEIASHYLSSSITRFFATQTELKVEPNTDIGYSQNRGNVKPFSAIPGPKGLPYLGTLLHYRFGRYSKDRYHEALLENYHKYGKIFKETLAGHTKVYLFDPDYISYVHNALGKIPHIPPLMETTQLYRKTKQMSLGLGNTNGDEWYHLRSAVQQMMMRPQAVSMFLPQVLEVIDDFIRFISTTRNKQTGEVDNFKNELLKWNLESSANTCFETRLGCLQAGPDSHLQNILEANRQIFELTHTLQFGIPWYKFFSTPTWKKLIAAEDLFFGYAQMLVDKTVAKIKDLISHEKLEEGAYSFLTYLISKEELSYKDVSIITMSLFADGLSTTVPSLIGQIYCLATNPDKQAKLFDVIQKVAPNKDQPITVEMLNNMPYLKACIKEGFRFFPIGTEVSRIPQTDMVIGGYHIPAGTHVQLNSQMLLQSPLYFMDPDVYRPERWVRGQSMENVHPYILLPFSHGPRTCAGKRFAEQEMQVMLIRLLQNFEISWPHKEKMRQRFCVLLMPDFPAQFKFTPRL